MPFNNYHFFTFLTPLLKKVAKWRQKLLNYSFNSDAGSGSVLVTMGDGLGVSGIAFEEADANAVAEAESKTVAESEALAESVMEEAEAVLVVAAVTAAVICFN